MLGYRNHWKKADQKGVVEVRLAPRSRNEDSRLLFFGRSEMKRVRERTLNWQLISLSLGLLLPTLAFVGVLLWQFSASERNRVEEEARSLSRGFAVALDREIGGVLATLQALGTSPSFKKEDFKAFYDQVREVALNQNINISLRDANGHALFTTRAAYGTDVAVPPILAAADQEVLKANTAQVSNIFTSTVAATPVFQIISAPIRSASLSTFVLGASIDTKYLAEVIRREHLPEAWIGSIVDRNGVFVARTERQSDLTGQLASADYRARATGAGGSYYGRNADGNEVLVGYAKSALTGWTTGANLGTSALNAPFRRSLLALLSLGICLGLISTGSAVLTGRRIGRAFERLSSAASAIGRGEQVSAVATRIVEINEVGLALSEAAKKLREREREKEDAQSALQSLNESLEAAVQRRTRDLIAVEAALHQSQKMEAVGQLTGGIAHDFNNMLAVIIGGLNLLQRRLARGETNVTKYVDGALDGATRAAALTHRLLAFSRQQPLAPESIDAGRMVLGMAELLSRSLGEQHRIETVFAAGLWKAQADPAQLESVILNLAVNARDAMPEGGRLTIETGNTHIDDHYARENELKAGQYVLIAVTDSGTGMTPEVVSKAFDPFFTTKAVGKGTGLGLSQVFGFARQSGGHVKIYSEVGHGTTIKLYLPRSYEEGRKLPLKSISEPAQTGDPSEIILVVEDQEQVRNLAVETLRDLGYTVLHASSGEGALKLIEEGQDVTLLFTDIVMPGMTGRQLSDAASLIRTSLKVLYTTGYSRNAIVHNGVLDPGTRLLSKPFTIEQLATSVRQAIDGG